MIDARSLGRGAVVSLGAHLALAGLGVFAAVDTAPDPAATSFWLLAGFAVLGAGVAVLVGAALRSPLRARSLVGLSVGLLAVSALVAVLAAAREGSATLIVVAGLLLLINGLLHGAALISRSGAWARMPDHGDRRV
jgi:peptidoglycan/LPS O-acetylase OafA/YrhL